MTKTPKLSATQQAIVDTMRASGNPLTCGRLGRSESWMITARPGLVESVNRAAAEKLVRLGVVVLFESAPGALRYRLAA